MGNDASAGFARLRGALNKGQLDAAQAVLHPDVEWHYLDVAKGTAVHRGRDGVKTFWFSLIAGWRDLNQETESVEEIDDDTLLVRSSFHGVGRQSGIATDTKFWELYRFESDLLVYTENFASREDALAAAAP